MRITIEITDSLMREARKHAAREGVTMRSLFERGLRRVVDDSKNKKPFKLRDASFKGKGLQPEFRNASWEKIRDLIYRS
jgi:hypothetical protein